MNVESLPPKKSTDDKVRGSNWNVEVGVTINTPVRGGILADKIGYGKTATTIGLIATDLKNKSFQKPEGCPSYLKVTSATLIFAPSHLLRQWADEFDKFLPG